MARMRNGLAPKIFGIALVMTQADAVRSHGIGRRILEAMMTLGWTKAPRHHSLSKGDQSTTGYTRALPPSSGPTGATGPQGNSGAVHTGPSPILPTGPAGAQGYTRPLPVDPRNTPPLQPTAEATEDVGMPDEADAEIDEHQAAALEKRSGHRRPTRLDAAPSANTG